MSVTADMLPDDILLTIFAYCSHDTLIGSIQFVCKRWHEVCHNKSLWTYIIYKPDANVSIAHIRGMLKLSPRLQVVDLSNLTFINEEVFKDLGDYCPDLKVLRLCELTNLEPTVLKYLVTKCPGIEEITVHLGCSEFVMLTVFTQLIQLKTLIVKTTFASFTGLRILSCNFPFLEHLELHGVEISNDDLVCLVNNKKHKLLTLRIPCTMCDGGCVLPLVSRCKRLRSLSLDSLCRTIDVQPETFTCFRTITSLSVHGGNFSSEPYCSVFFKMFSQVVNLQISFCGAYDDSIIDVIARNCPSIHTLAFDGFGGDETLKRLHLLKELQSLTVRWYSDISSEGLGYLHNVSKLTSLKFFQCGCLTGASLDVLSYFRKLHILEFYHCRGMSGISVDGVRRRFPRVRLTLIN